MDTFYFENRHIDYIGNEEHKFTLFVAYKSDPKLRVVGYIDYTLLGNELHIDYIEVSEDERKKGIGKALYRRLYQLNNNYDFLRSSYYTDEGLKLRYWFEKAVLGKMKLRKTNGE